MEAVLQGQGAQRWLAGEIIPQPRHPMRRQGLGMGGEPPSARLLFAVLFGLPVLWQALCQGTPLRHWVAKPKQRTSLSLIAAGGPPRHHEADRTLVEIINDDVHDVPCSEEGFKSEIHGPISFGERL